jgi:succinate dehydrogenase/fumarate reductase flavoprotein subunit
MTEELNADLLVLGGGMAGVSAAAFAAEQGLKVTVVEPAQDIGGSAGDLRATIWTAASEAAMRSMDPEVDLRLGRILIDEVGSGVEWVASLGVEVPAAVPLQAMMGFEAYGRVIDVRSFMNACRNVVLSAGGGVLTRTRPISLLHEGGRVAGAMLQSDGGKTQARAFRTLIATGGYQGDPASRLQHIGAHAEQLFLRANPYSTGGGLKLAQSAGAVLQPWRETFYGHLLPSPLQGPIDPADFSRLTQFYTAHSILLDELGARFVDESRAYYGNALAVAKRPGQRALLVADDRIRQANRGDSKSSAKNAAQIDRIDEAQIRGARVAVATNLAELEQSVRPWGYTGLKSAVEAFNVDMTSATEPGWPGRWRHRNPFENPPFFAMEVQPAITFGFRGLDTDVDGRALTERGTPIAGLFVAGADACFYQKTYFGGLSLALVFGRRAARAIVAEKAAAAAY